MKQSYEIDHERSLLSLLLLMNLSKVHAMKIIQLEDVRVCRSEEHTSELQSRGLISYAVFCLIKFFNSTKLYILHYNIIFCIWSVRYAIYVDVVITFNFN